MTHPNLLDQLQMFVVAADLGSFSATARHLGRAQNAVSYGIANLEKQLQIELFDRNGHKAVLTGPGQALRREADSLVRSAADLVRRAGELSAGLETVLTIAVDDLVPLDLLMPPLRALSHHHPGLELRLNRTAGQAAHRQVAGGPATIGVAAVRPEAMAAFAFVIIGQVRMTPVISPAVHQREQGAAFDRPRLRQIVLSASETPEASPDLGVLSGHIWRVLDLRSKHDLIRRGLGWGMMPTHLVDREISRGELTGLRLVELAVDPEIPILLFHRKDAALGPAGQLFRERATATVHGETKR